MTSYLKQFNKTNLIKGSTILLFAFPLFVNANPVEIDIKYGDIETECRKQFGEQLNNSIVMGCADQASDAAKKDMNVLYQKTFKLLEKRDANLAVQFEEAQKAWIIYRERTCDIQGFVIGTPMYSVCRLDFNVSRVGEINVLFESID